MICEIDYDKDAEGVEMYFIRHYDNVRGLIEHTRPAQTDWVEAVYLTPDCAARLRELSEVEDVK